MGSVAIEGVVMDAAYLPEMVALAFASYVGFSTTEVLGGHDVEIAHDLRWVLEHFVALSGRFELVWGPATERLPLTLFDENMMFVCRDLSSTPTYVVVIRGTNPISLANWVIEDFAVMFHPTWEKGETGEGAAAISLGTRLGLDVLKNIAPEPSLLGAGTTTREFLADAVKAHSEGIRVIVVGHSLGGALAPTFALWLEETRRGDEENEAWDPDGKATIEVVSLAGPTPGNRAFSERYDAVLGPRTRRIWNYYDVVPHAWVSSELNGIEKLYEPIVPSSIFLEALARLTVLMAQNGNYTHLAGMGDRCDGELQAELGFVAQAIYQHTLPYVALTRRERALPISTRLQPDEHAPGPAFPAMMHACFRRLLPDSKALQDRLEKALPVTPTVRLSDRALQFSGALLAKLAPEDAREQVRNARKTRKR